MASSDDNKDVCIGGSSTKGGVEVKLVLLRMLTQLRRSQTFVFPWPPSLLFGRLTKQRSS